MNIFFYDFMRKFLYHEKFQLTETDTGKFPVIYKFSHTYYKLGHFRIFHINPELINSTSNVQLW